MMEDTQTQYRGLVNGRLTITSVESPFPGGTVTLDFKNYPLEASVVEFINQVLVSVAGDMLPSQDVTTRSVNP